MLKEYAEKYIQLGAKIADARALFSPGIALQIEGEWIGGNPEEDKQELAKQLGEVLTELRELCERLDLPVSAALIESQVDAPPQTDGELDLLIRAVITELKTRLFLFVPPHAAKFYEWDEIVSDAVKLAFPSCSAEIRLAGSSFAASLYTACIFHAMRAAEIGVRALATDLQIQFPHPLKLTEWGAIQDKIDTAVKAIKQQPRTTKRDDDQRFYSEAAAQLRYFKDGWRLRAAHARETFTEQQAATVIEHVREFFETVAVRLSE